MASQALTGLAHRDNLAPQIQYTLTAANTAYKQWRLFVALNIIFRPNFEVPGLGLRPRPATAHTRERWLQ